MIDPPAKISAAKPPRPKSNGTVHRVIPSKPAQLPTAPTPREISTAEQPDGAVITELGPTPGRYKRKLYRFGRGRFGSNLEMSPTSSPPPRADSEMSTPTKQVRSIAYGMAGSEESPSPGQRISIMVRKGTVISGRNSTTPVRGASEEGSSLPATNCGVMVTKKGGERIKLQRRVWSMTNLTAFGWWKLIGGSEGWHRLWGSALADTDETLQHSTIISFGRSANAAAQQGSGKQFWEKALGSPSFGENAAASPKHERSKAQGLPVNVAVGIFSFLPLKSLRSAAQVSRDWKEIAESRLLWRRTELLSPIRGTANTSSLFRPAVSLKTMVEKENRKNPEQDTAMDECPSASSATFPMELTPEGDFNRGTSQLESGDAFSSPTRGLRPSMGGLSNPNVVRSLLSERVAPGFLSPLIPRPSLLHETSAAVTSPSQQHTKKRKETPSVESPTKRQAVGAQPCR